MSTRIVPTTRDSAPAATRPLLDQMQATIGMIPKLYATMGHSPGSLQSYLAWDTAVARSSLSRREIELLNLHVSELNGCAYCVSAHHFVAGKSGLDDATIASARAGKGANAREDALLALARRVVRTGGQGAGSDLVRAREAGVSDAEIIDTLAIIALKTFSNSLALVARTEIDFPRPPYPPAE